MTEQVTQQVVSSILKPRDPNSHKGSYGHSLLCCGSSLYRGAARLSAEGCARMGSGIVTLAATEKVLSCVLPALPEVICLPMQEAESGCIDSCSLPFLLSGTKKATALLIGCGLTASYDTLALLEGILSETSLPLVIDADGLNLLAKLPPVNFRERNCILTPHPGELARILHLSQEEVLKAPRQAALKAAQIYGCVVLCKEHRTAIALPDGQVWENTTGNAGLARGGSGDYLAGMITALLAQGHTPKNSALCAVWLHGAAADVCANQKSEITMLPHDLSVGLSAVCKEILKISK